MMSERLKPIIRFEKGSVLAMCANAKAVAVVATLHDQDDA